MVKKIWPILVILAAIIIYFWPNLTWPAVNITPQVGTNDFTDQFYPIIDFSLKSLKGGELPLWFPGFSSGYPALAGSNLFYPLRWPLLLFPLSTAVNLGILIPYFLLGLGSYLFFRELKFSQLASLFGALSLTFSGYAIHELMHLDALTSLGFLMFELFFWERFFKTKKFIYPTLAGLTFGLQLLGGHFQFTFYGMLFLTPYVLFLKTLKKESLWRLALGFLIFLILGLLIASVQLLPTIESIKASTRSTGLAAESILRYNFPIKNLKTFILPYSDYGTEQTLETFNHNGWPAEERYGYIGIIPLLLALFAILKLIKKPRILFFTITFLFFLLLAFGNQTFLSFILLLPVFNFFRAPTHFLMLVDLSLICLAVFGFDFLETLVKRKWLLVLMIAISMVDVFFWGKKLYPAVRSQEWYQTPEVVSYLQKNLKTGERVVNEHYYYPSARIFLNQPELWDDPQIFINLQNLVPAFDGLMYDLPMAVGAANSGTLKISRYNALEMDIVFGGLKYGNDLKIADFSPWYLPLNRLLGVRFLLFSSPVDNPALGLVYQTDFQNGQDNIFVYRLKDTLPRAFLVGETMVLTPEAIKERLMDPEFDPRQTMLLEEKIEWGGEALGVAEAKIKKSGNQELEIEINTDKNSFLFVSDPFYPGWEAFVDGEKSSIYRADYAFRAVQVKEGKHKVVFKYKPASLAKGLKITVFGLVLTAGLLIFFFLTERTRQRGPPGK